MDHSEERPVIVELPLDAYLPPEYVTDEIERVDLYRRASGLRSLAETDDLAEELTDRFGSLTEPTLNLLGLSRIKVLAREVGASAVNYRSGALTITGVTSETPALLRKATGATVGGREGRVTLRGSEKKPLELAEEALRSLSESAS